MERTISNILNQKLLSNPIKIYLNTSNSIHFYIAQHKI
nr:MAG TPA: hypothetical protein [Caudoviricetes sp.]